MLRLQGVPCSVAGEQEKEKAVWAAAQLQGGESTRDVSGVGGDMGMGGELDSTRKLVILGLPWDTTEGSLERHFSQIGPLQARPLFPCNDGAPSHIWRGRAASLMPGPATCA